MDASTVYRTLDSFEAEGMVVSDREPELTRSPDGTVYPPGEELLRTWVSSFGPPIVFTRSWRYDKSVDG